MALPRIRSFTRSDPEVSMRWFRANRGSAVWLAAFALACQFYFSFGHFHLGKFSSTPIGIAVADDGADSTVVPPPSPQKNSTVLPDDFCAICAQITLLAVLAVVVIAGPTIFGRAFLWAPAAVELGSFDHLLFEARGPPQA